MGRKIIVSILLFSLLLIGTAAVSAQVAVGDIITFGSYEQDNDLSNGPEPIEWQVLSVEEGRALLISRYGLDAKRYNEEWENVTWETCTLRTWLNEEFFNNAFSFDEQERIVQVTLSNPASPQVRANGGKDRNDTSDRIFLLSIYEVDRYFPNDVARRCEATAYAMANEAYTEKGYSCWWLRTEAYYNACESFVSDTGSVQENGYRIFRDDVTVRPVFWLDL